MQLSSLVVSALAFSVLAFGNASGAILSDKRQIVIPAHGTTTAPPDGSTITPGTSFPFTYRNVNSCESGYSAITIYLSTEPPTSADVTTDGHLADGSFAFHFGDYLIPNFGLPTMGTPPPASLTAPDVNAPAGSTLFFSVVETFRDCPGGIQLEFGLETTTVVYA